MEQLDPFINACRAAATSSDAYDAVGTLMEEFVAAGDEWAEVIPPATVEGRTSDGQLLGADETLFEDDTVTVILVETEPGIDQPPHDHLMPTVIGVFEGTEVHRFYERSTSGPPLVTAGGRTVGAGSVIRLPADAVHAIAAETPSRCRAMHVYLGRLSTVERSLFHPDTFEESPLTTEAYNATCRPTATRG